MNGWFILPNWVFYYGQFITIVQIGLIDGLSKVAAVGLEVPSGAISDYFGKKLTLILGNICFILSCIIILYATSFSGLLIGNIIMFVGFAFVSGAKEALLYDSMLESKTEEHYDEVLGKVNSVSIAITIISIFVGGWLFGIDPKLTFIAWIVFSAVSIVVLLFIKEPSIDSVTSTYSSYFATLKSGVHAIFQKSFRPYVVTVLFWSMFIKAYEGVIRQSMGSYFGYTGETLGYTIALVSIPALVVAFNYKKIKDFLGDKRIEFTLILMFLVAFSVAFVASIIAGMATFLFLYVAQEIAKPYVLGLVNKNIDSKHRATALSTVSLFSEIPYIIIVIGMGQLMSPSNIHYLYILFIGFLLVYATGIRFVRK